MLTVKLWAASPTELKRLMDLTIGEDDYEEKVFKIAYPTNLDMTGQGWIEIGTVSMDFHLELTDTTTQAAMAAFDLAEEKLRSEFNDKLAQLLQAKQEFLSLPAPKEDDNDIPF